MALTIKLEGLLWESGYHQEIDDGRGWIEWRALKLMDAIANQAIAEWFYVAACNRYYYQKKILTEYQGKENAFLIQQDYDEARLFNFTQNKLLKVHFRDWEDFYSKMSREFIYEEDLTGLVGPAS